MEGCHLSCSFYGCKRTYTNSENLNSHIKDHHKISAQSLPGKNFLCSTIGCDGSFSNMQQLMDHMRHHHKPNYFFLCESCKAKLRSYRTLLKHLQTCAKVAKTKAIKAEDGDAEGSGVPLIPGNTEPPGPFLPTDETQQMESEPSLPLTTSLQPSAVLLNPNSMSLPTEVVAANAQRVPGQADSSYSPFPPRLSPVPSASLSEAAHPEQQQQQQQQQQPPQWSPRIGPSSLPSSPPHTPPGSNAVWRKNQGQSFSSRILWEHTRGRYSCLQCGHCTPDRKEMTAHIEGQHKSPGGKANSDADAVVGSPSALIKTQSDSETLNYTQL